MSLENATPQAGASIHDRLVGFLSAPSSEGEAAQPTPQAHQQEQEPAMGADPNPEIYDEGAEVEAPEIEAEGAQEQEAIEEGAEDEEGEPRNLEDVAEYLGIDANMLAVDDNGELAIKTKIDGVEGHAKLSDLVKSHQLEGHLNKQLMEVAEQRKAIEAQQTEIQSKAQEQIQMAEDMIRIVAQEVLGEYNKIDWDNLEIDDPGEYAAKQLKYQQKFDMLDARLKQVQQQRVQHTQIFTQEQRQKAVSTLVDAIPTWRDEGVRSKELADISKYAVDIGIPPERVNRIIDPVEVLTLRKAMLYDALQKGKPVLDTKVKKVPKVAKPGTPIARKPQKVKELDAARQRIKSTGGARGSVADFLLKSGKV